MNTAERNIRANEIFKYSENIQIFGYPKLVHLFAPELI